MTAREPTNQRSIPALSVLFSIPPTILLVDLLQLWGTVGLDRLYGVIAVACLIWLCTGFVSFMLGRAGRAGQGIASFLLLGNAMLFAVGITEGMLRLLPSGGNTTQSYWDPNKSLEMEKPDGLPGVNGPSRFTTNEAGLRGPSRKLLGGRTNAYRIVTVGGSTTEGLYLDDTEQWPAVLMDKLNQLQKERFYFVENAGVSGHTAEEHLAFMKHMPAVAEADAWIILVGINDLAVALAAEGKPMQKELEERVSKLTFVSERPFLRRLRLFKLARQVRSRFTDSDIRINTSWYVEKRAQRMRSSYEPIPDLSISLAEYEQRLSRIMDHCEASGKRCVFVTQPTMWREDLPEHEKRLLWFGWVGRDPKKGYSSPSELSRAIQSFNNVLLRECARRNQIYYDLAAEIPKDTTSFFDDCHFNESGARMVADKLAGFLATLDRKVQSSSAPSMNGLVNVTSRPQ